MSHWRNRQTAFLVIAFWCLALWSCNRLLTPPDLGKNPIALTSYAVDHALTHLKHIAAEPHPVGSGAHQRVANYLIEQIELLGYLADVQETVIASTFDKSHRSDKKPRLQAAWIKNIAVRIPGTESQSAVLIAGHYDSVESAPGAADDGAAVASMLEVLRLLKNAGPFKNDLIFLFSDAEELGLLGGRAFVEQHSWAEDVALALNFEARGNRGALLMFETSDRNGGLIESYARSASNPVASSLMFSVYKKLMHHDTDFSVFKQAGMAGLNFAFIEGGTSYHTRLDNLEGLDPRTLNQQGQNMLQFARYFADADLQQIEQQTDQGYFNLPFDKLFTFPLSSNLPQITAGSLFLLFTLLVAWGVYVKKIRPMHCLAQTLIYLLLSGLCVATNYGLYATIRHIYRNFDWLPEPYNASLYFVAFCFITIGLFTLLCLKLGQRIRPEELAAGVMFIWLAAGIYLAIEFPGGIFFTAVPALSMTCAWAYWLFRSRSDRYFAFIIAVCSAFALTIIAPTLYLAHHALGFHADWLLMILVVLTLGLLTHALDILYRALREAMPIFFLVAAVLMLIWAHTLSDFSADRPRPNSIVYALDIPNHSAKWFSYDPEPDDWTRQFLGANPVVTHAGIFDQFAPGLRLLEQQTSPVDLVAPDVHLVDQRRAQGKNYVKVRIKSNRDASFMRIRFDGLGDMIAFYAGDRLVYRKNQAVSLASIDLHALPKQGTILTFVLPADITLRQLEIFETRSELGEIRRSEYQSRPENSMPKRSSPTLPVDAVILRQLYFL